MEFDKATGYVRQKPPTHNQDALLQLYALFKCATAGPAPKDERPSFWQMKERSKYDAWAQLGDMDAGVAKERYVQLLDTIEPSWRDCEISMDANPMGMAVSTLLSEPSDAIDDPVFEACRNGKVDFLKTYLEKEPSCARKKDEQGMTLLHWAADAGLVACVSLLLPYSDLNAVDNELQTPLHLAIECENWNVVQLLLKHAPDLTLKNIEGVSIQDMLQNHHEFLDAK